MQTTVFIFTHLIMISAVSSVLYIGLAAEPEDTAAYSFVPAAWAPHLLNKFKAFGFGLKARVLLVSDHIARVKISPWFTRKPGHTL